MLDEVMSLGRQANLMLVVFGYDQFSGARKMFYSKKFTASDISLGRFDDLTVVEESTAQHKVASEGEDG